MKLLYKSRIPEANIQAEIYHQCKLKGIDVLLEYKVDHCRLDIVILKEDDIVAIVEVKSYSLPEEPNLNTKQLIKYKKFGIPILVCGRLEKVPEIMNEVARLL